MATQAAQVIEDILASTPSPWNTDWLPEDNQLTIDRINGILNRSGLAQQGSEILKYSKELGINPAFTLAMFRKEANFAKPGTRAHNNKNPGNIIATGECRGLAAGSSCSGNYGEISTDGRFGIYASMADGIKAYNTLLSREYKPGTRRNCSDILCIISAYCPAPECDPAIYAGQITIWTMDYQKSIVSPD